MSAPNSISLLCLFGAALFDAATADAYQKTTTLSYTIGSNLLQGHSKTDRENFDFDWLECVWWDDDDIFGTYCSLYSLTLNDPYVVAHTVSPSGVSSFKGDDEDVWHASVPYVVTGTHGKWTAQGIHYIHQTVLYMSCPFGSCGLWYPVYQGYIYLSNTEAQHSPIFIDVSRHVIAPTLTDTNVDSILASATSILQTDDGLGDVACPITLRRSGTVSTFSETDGSIDSLEEFELAAAAPGRVSGVDDVNWCNGEPAPTALACSGGIGMVVTRQPALEGILWAHEYGHNQGLWLIGENPHNPSQDFVGYEHLVSTALRVLQFECNLMRTPQN